MTARRMTHGVLCAALATVRAAGGSRVSVSLTVEDDILLNVTDDGLPGQRHLEIEQAAPAELQTIAECAHALGGRLYTEHRPERGTTLVLELPRVQPVRRDLEDERWPAAVPENEPSPSLRVFVLDPHGVRRAGLRHFLDAQDDLRVVGNAATISEARRSIGWLRPDVVFLDAEDETAPAATHEVHQVSPDSIVVGLTSRMGKALDGELLKAGAAGVLPQDLERTELLGAIRRLVRGESPELQTSTAHAVPQGASVLNSREWEVLKLIVEGRTNAEIAAEIYLAPKSIERHVAAVIRKVGARNRAHLVALAIGRGLVRAPLD
jgi:DNA-binding NarL/FixJ family response regulator